MANEQNLRPSEYKLSQEEAKKGGINSGIARREKGRMKKELEMLLDETNKKGITYSKLSTLGLIKGAIDGKAENYKLMLALLGELEEKESNETPSVQINIVDNSNLEKVMYDKDNTKSQI